MKRSRAGKTPVYYVNYNNMQLLHKFDALVYIDKR